MTGRGQRQKMQSVANTCIYVETINPQINLTPEIFLVTRFDDFRQIIVVVREGE